MRSNLLHHLVIFPLLGGASIGATEIGAGGAGTPESSTATAGGVITADPGSQAWEPAHWEDRGATHVWVDGHYVPRPAAPPPNVVWESGHWTWSQDGWVWNAGHYVSTAPAPQTDPQVSEVVVEQAPPPVQVDVVTTCPGPDYNWCDGYWDYRATTWVWIPGGWCHRPYVGAVWSGPRWDHVDHFDHDRGDHDRFDHFDHDRGDHDRFDHGDHDHGGFGSRGAIGVHGGFRFSPGHWRGR